MKIQIVLSFIILLIGGCSSTEPIYHLVEQCGESAIEYSNNRSGTAILIMVNGEVVIEDYHPDYDPSRAHTLTEISTLLLALTVLAAEDDGLLSTDDLAANTISSWNQDQKKAKITITDLLQSTSGLEPGTFHRSSSFENVFDAQIHFEPGTHFRFGPTPYQALGLLIRKHVDSSYFIDRVLSHLDIPGERWAITSGLTIDPQTGETSFTVRYFDGAHLTARELGRIGTLIMNNGQWEGQNIISDLMNRLTEPSPVAPGFGNSVWLNTNTDQEAFSDFFRNISGDVIHLSGSEKLIYDYEPEDLIMTAGRYNQRLYIIPSKEMVIVRFGGENFTWSDNDFLSSIFCN